MQSLRWPFVAFTPGTAVLMVTPPLEAPEPGPIADTAAIDQAVRISHITPLTPRVPLRVLLPLLLPALIALSTQLPLRDFVAGLALPRQRITGLEDPNRPDGIWPFAWNVAKAHLPSEDSIALVINPPSTWSQNQRHVHILQLRPVWRMALDTDTPVLPEGVVAIKRSHINME